MPVAGDRPGHGVLRGEAMLIVTEETCRQVISRADAFQAVEAVFSAMSAGDAYNFPVVREAIGYADALYGFKSGFDRAGLALGVKSGGYWPGNIEKGLSNHQSTIFLFDPDTGQLHALVGGNYLTAIRTAAASAVSIAHLARRNVKTMAMVGAGHQSAFQLRAALEQRQFENVIGWNLHEDKLAALAAVAAEFDLPFEAVTREQIGARADVIITITSAHEPLLMNDWIKPGTHIAAMGTDTRGKQELDAELVAAASVFTDEVAQSISIGETQHAVAAGLLKETDIVPLGAVIRGEHPGRSDDDQITVFDGTGVGLQDLAVASSAAKLAQERGLAQKIEL